MKRDAKAERMSLERALKIHEMTQTDGWAHVVDYLRTLEEKNEEVIFSSENPETQFALHQAIGGSKTIRGIITLVSLASHTARTASSETDHASSAE